MTEENCFGFVGIFSVVLGPKKNNRGLAIKVSRKKNFRMTLKMFAYDSF